MTTIQTLECIYGDFVNREQPFGFFKGLYEYLNYVFREPELKKVFDQQIEERKVLYEQIENLEEETRNELNQAKTKLFELIKKVGVDVASFNRYLTFSINGKTTLLEELEAYENRNILGSVFVSDEIVRYLFDITANLFIAGCDKALGEYVVPHNEYLRLSDNGPGQYLRFGHQDGTFIFSKKWHKRREKEQDFEHERMLKPWGSFERLLAFKIAYELPRTSMNAGLTSAGGTESKWWFGAAKERNNIVSLARELHRLAESQLDFHSMVSTRFEKVQVGELKNLKQIAFRDAVQTAHSLLLRVADSKTEKDIVVESKTKFDPSSGVLKCEFIIHSFHRGQRGEKERISFFRLLWEDRRLIKNGKEKITGKARTPAYFAVHLNITSDASTFDRNKKAKDKLSGLIKGINKTLKRKGFPAHIERKGGVQLVIIEK